MDGRAHGPSACSLSARRGAWKGRPLRFPPLHLTSCVAERLQKVPRLAWPRSILWKGCFQSEAQRGHRGQQDACVLTLPFSLQGPTRPLARLHTYSLHTSWMPSCRPEPWLTHACADGLWDAEARLAWCQARPRPAGWEGREAEALGGCIGSLADGCLTLCRVPGGCAPSGLGSPTCMGRRPPGYISRTGWCSGWWRGAQGSGGRRQAEEDAGCQLIWSVRSRSRHPC